MEIIITTGGTVRCIYAETVDLSGLGEVCIRRASHVEPDATGQWWADLSPVAGPKLGPFKARRQALAAEVEWLGRHLSDTAVAEV